MLTSDAAIAGFFAFLARVQQTPAVASDVPQHGLTRRNDSRAAPGELSGELARRGVLLKVGIEPMLRANRVRLAALAG